MPQKSRQTGKTGFRGGDPSVVGKSTQFKAGPEWTGNAGGRPRSKVLSQAYRERLAELEENGDRSRAERIADAMVAEAERGSVSAALELGNRTEGKPMQPIALHHGITEQTARIIAELAQRLLSPEQIRGTVEGEYLHPLSCNCEACGRKRRTNREAEASKRLSQTTTLAQTDCAIVNRAEVPHVPSASSVPGVPISGVGANYSIPIDLQTGERWRKE